MTLGGLDAARFMGSDHIGINIDCCNSCGSRRLAGLDARRARLFCDVLLGSGAGLTSVRIFASLLGIFAGFVFGMESLIFQVHVVIMSAVLDGTIVIIFRDP